MRAGSGVETRSLHRAGDSLDAIGDGAIALAERDGVNVVEMDDLPLRVACRRDRTQTAEDPLAAEGLVQVIQMPHAIQQRKNRGLRANCRTD
jgi:hypothetical protein